MTHIVLITTNALDSRKICEQIEAQTYESVEVLQRLIESKITNYYSIIALTEFMDMCNNQEINLEDSFLSYVKIL